MPSNSCFQWNNTSFQCWSFMVTVAISAFVLAISAAGLAGVFLAFPGDNGFFSGLVGTVIGLWFPRPTIQPQANDLELAKGANNVNDTTTNVDHVFVDGQE